MAGRRNGKKMFARRPAVSLLAVCLFTVNLLAGCGFDEGGFAGQKTSVVGGMETEPVLSYEVPSMEPGVRVNRAGYVPKEEKIAVFCGERLPDSFQVVDAETGEAVFWGSVEQSGYDTVNGEYIGYGDFTSFQTEGAYYLACDILGYSYSFSIDADCHKALLWEGFGLLTEQERLLEKKDILAVCGSASALLLSYELYGSVHEEGVPQGSQPAVVSQAKRYAELLLGWQDEESGAVFSEAGELLAEETAWVSATLAKFSYTYQKYDSVYATACLQAADRAWQYLTRTADIQGATPEARFFAAAELYRATGQGQYHEALTALGKELSDHPEKEAQAYGTFTYAATKRQVDVELCGSLLAVFLNNAEAVAERAKDNVFMVGGSLAEEEIGSVLWDAVIVAAVDYVITNSEYATILQNYQSYFAGVNEQAYNYLYGEPEQPGVGADSVNTARYIMMLSEVMSHENI